MQHSEWTHKEANAWWHRNKTALTDPTRGHRDWPLRMIARHRPPMGHILEVGCASGWRLDILRCLYQADCHGIDPSVDAIVDGCEMYPDVLLTVGTVDLIRYPARMFDLLVVSFVLHWIDRELLAKSVAEIDRVLKPGGYLVIADFLPDVPTKVRYHHRQDVEMWTYKQNYAAIFEALGTYRLIECAVFNHDTGAPGDAPPEQRAACVLLRKEEQYQ